MKYWEIIADNLKKCGWSLGWVSAVGSEGRKVWIVDEPRYGQRLVVRAAEKLTACVEPESAIRANDRLCLTSRQDFFKTRRHQTDLNQAEDTSPLGSSPFPGPRNRRKSTQRGKRKEESYESA